LSSAAAFLISACLCGETHSVNFFRVGFFAICRLPPMGVILHPAFTLKGEATDCGQQPAASWPTADETADDPEANI
jgi:hypothetical protein